MSLFTEGPKCFEQSELNNNTIYKISNDKSWNNTIYGKHWILSSTASECSWSIKIIQKKSKWPSIAFGIISERHHQNIHKDFDTKNSYYLANDGKHTIDGAIFDRDQLQIKGLKISKGDVLKYTLDLKKFEIRAQKNNDEEIKISSVKKRDNAKYRFALALRNIGDKVTVTTTGIRHHLFDVIDDEKKMESQIKATDTTLKLIEQISKLEYDNQQKTAQIMEYTQKNEKLITKVASMENKMSAMDSQIQSVMEENDRMKNIISTLEHEKKEFEVEIIEIKKENKKLKLANIDTNAWKNWEYQQIICWIISLDTKMYSQYEQKLTRSLKEEQVNGEVLGMVDIADLKRWGIVNFMHSKTLLKHIQILITDKLNENKEGGLTAYI